MTHPLYPRSLRDAVLREDLSSFIAKSFASINPGTEYLPNWHIDAIAEHLRACERGEITRLIINMPPRALKSVCVSVAWPAWLLGHDPAARIITASYSRELAMQHAADTRAVIASPWYRGAFPHTHIQRGKDEKHRFYTTQHGMRLATSVGGTLTGDGGNWLILDDPLNPSQAMSHVQRGHANQWCRHTFMTRLNDKQKGVIVLVMQRLHEEDVTGFLLGQGEENTHHWHHLCLPARAPTAQQIAVGRRLWQREAGDILHPSREGDALLARAQAEMGSHAFAAQYQQQPVPQQGMLVRSSWFPRYRHLPPEGRIVHSWDTAIKTGREHDYSVCTHWLLAEDGCYLLRVSRGQWEYPDLKRRMLARAEEEQPHVILLEDKASGQGLLQELRRETHLPLIGIMPKQDKVTRLAQVTPLMEAGKVWLPDAEGGHAPAWLAAYESELYGFPNGAHDDQVDSTSQFLHWMRAQSQHGVRVRGV